MHTERFRQLQRHAQVVSSPRSSKAGVARCSSVAAAASGKGAASGNASSASLACSSAASVLSSCSAAVAACSCTGPVSCVELGECHMFGKHPCPLAADSVQCPGYVIGIVQQKKTCESCMQLIVTGRQAGRYEL